MSAIINQVPEKPMPRRNDPMYYEFDIRENKTKEVHRVRIFCWWTGEHSIAERQQMCDCQLGAFFSMRPEDFNTWEGYLKYGPGAGQLSSRQSEYLKLHPCNHKPSRKYTATRAYIPSGDVVDIAA